MIYLILYNTLFDTLFHKFNTQYMQLIQLQRKYVWCKQILNNLTKIDEAGK